MSVQLISLPSVAHMVADPLERARLLWETAVCDQYREDARPLDPTCGDCAYCCWAYRVPVPVPDVVGRPTEETCFKQPRQMCSYLRGGQCSIHAHPAYPTACSTFECAYLKRERGVKLKGEVRRGLLTEIETLNFRIHRPDAFRQFVPMNGKQELYFPAVPSHIPVARAAELIHETNCIPDVATGMWHLQVLL